MVLDTKWKRFKFSSGNKLLCVLLACVMVAVLMCNLLQFVKFGAFYRDDFFKQEITSFYETYPFQRAFNQYIHSIEYDLTANAREKERNAYVNSFFTAYKKAELENRLSDEEAQALIDNYKASYGEGELDWDWYYEEYGEYPSDLSEIRLDDIRYYRGEDGNYYSKYMAYDKSIVSYEDNKDGINFGYNDDIAEDRIESYYNNHYNYYFDDYYKDRSYENLKNIRYYAVHNDKTVITNVTSDVNAFIQSVKNGEGDSIVYEPAKNIYIASGGFNNTDFGGFYSPNKDFNIYIQVDPNFQADDILKEIYSNYLEAESIVLKFVCINMLISVIALIALAVVSCRLAGHKDGTLSMAKLDKIPADIHFALLCMAVGFAGFGICSIIIDFAECFVRYYNINYTGIEHLFCLSGWVCTLISLLAILIWLMILSFATSLSRAIKSDYPVFSKLVIVRIIVLLFKALIWSIKKLGKVFIWILKAIAKGIRNIFKGIGKLIKLIFTFAFRPKKLHKLSAPAVILYTLFNFVSLGVIILLFAAWDGFANFCGFLGTIVLLGADAYMVYHAVKYMKSLDDIIAASEKGEPLPYKTDKLPQSLKILADSLESTSAQLQQAVIKAVKDERTKTELITNVSHDLKTPLTSVINYINLLQKCDIYGEDAKKYMAVIAEKSNKLKRLIEDLIEASKVSTGNVTINKTLLNLNELATQAVVEETADIEKNNLQIIFEESVDKHIVTADGTKVYRVFENLLSNARKYSAPGSRVYVRVYSDHKYGYFEIKNISKEPLNISADELTERFVRGDKSRSQDGNGLGLSIAKELCKLNNGELIITIDGDLFKATVKLPKN